MNSRLTAGFLALLAKLPEPVKVRAHKAYRLWRENPSHPGLCFKRVHTQEPMFSVRVSLNWRAVGLLEGDTMYWCWIGSHDDYMRFLDSM